MPDIDPTSTKTVRLGSLSNGDVFLRTSSRHGHEIAMIFSGQGMLVLSGPDEFLAFQRMPAHANQQVLRIASAAELTLRTTPSHTFENRAAVQAGRVLIDAEGAHVTARWGKDGDFVRVRIDCSHHDDQFQGIELDQWELVTIDQFGNAEVLASYCAVVSQP